MAWSEDTVTVAILIATIKTRLEANGWTLTDRAADQVWHADNSQGARCIIQITNCQQSGAAASAAANCFLQFRAWRLWNTGTHAGTDGTGTNYQRVYYASTDVPDSSTVKLYMSVNSNRFIIAVFGLTGYRNWAYFGGLDTDTAGTSDKGCVVLVTSYESSGYASEFGYILSHPYWTTPWGMVSYGGMPGWTYLADNSGQSVQINRLPQISFMNLPDKVMLWPCLLLFSQQPNSFNTAMPLAIGFLDGLKFWPTAGGTGSAVDVATVDGVSWLLFVPGGMGADAAAQHPFTGQYYQGLAIGEV